MLNFTKLLLASMGLLCACTSVTKQAVPKNTIWKPPPIIATAPIPRNTSAQTSLRRAQRTTSRVTNPRLMWHDSRGYITQGIATWYKRSEHGKRTSSGQIYDLYGMTAAHATLPILTQVKVKNLRTGRSVIVTVNDRLNDKYAVIKLSYWAARHLRLTKRHSQKIEVVGLK